MIGNDSELNDWGMDENWQIRFLRDAFGRVDSSPTKIKKQEPTCSNSTISRSSLFQNDIDVCGKKETHEQSKPLTGTVENRTRSVCPPVCPTTLRRASFPGLDWGSSSGVTITLTGRGVTVTRYSSSADLDTFVFIDANATGYYQFQYSIELYPLGLSVAGIRPLQQLH